jgi:uncharacterized protein
MSQAMYRKNREEKAERRRTTRRKKDKEVYVLYRITSPEGSMTDRKIEVAHGEEHGRRGAFYIEREGRHIGELAYERLDENLVDILHTEVDPAFGGQGFARALLDAAVRWARETDTKFKVTCPYARAQFRKDESIRDVLAQNESGPARP